MAAAVSWFGVLHGSLIGYSVHAAVLALALSPQTIRLARGELGNFHPHEMTADTKYAPSGRAAAGQQLARNSKVCMPSPILGRVTAVTWVDGTHTVRLGQDAQDMGLPPVTSKLPGPFASSFGIALPTQRHRPHRSGRKPRPMGCLSVNEVYICDAQNAQCEHRLEGRHSTAPNAKYLGDQRSATRKNGSCTLTPKDALCNASNVDC